MNDPIIQSIRPSKLWYFLPVLLLTGGALTGVKCFRDIKRQLDRRPQYVPAPGSAKIHLDQPGEYLICYEHHCVIGDRTYVSPQQIPGLKVRITSVSSNQQVAVEPLSYNYTYSFGRRSGVGLWRYRIDQPGDYQVMVWYPQGVEGPENLVLAADEKMQLGRWFATIGLSIAAIMSLPASVAIWIVVLLQRRAAKRRLQAPVPPPPPVGRTS